MKVKVDRENTLLVNCKPILAWQECKRRLDFLVRIPVFLGCNWGWVKSHQNCNRHIRELQKVYFARWDPKLLIGAFDCHRRGMGFASRNGAYVTPRHTWGSANRTLVYVLHVQVYWHRT